MVSKTMILDVQVASAERQFAQHGMIIRLNIDKEDAKELYEELKEVFNEGKTEIKE